MRGNVTFVGNKFDVWFRKHFSWKNEISWWFVDIIKFNTFNAKKRNPQM